MSSIVELHPSGHRFQAESGETVLEAALRAGRSPAFGCGRETAWPLSAAA